MPFLSSINHLLLHSLAFVGCALFVSCSSNPAAVRKPQLIIGERGKGPAQFEKPRALAVSPLDSTLVVIDRQGRVQVFDADGEFVREWLMPEIEKGTPTGCSLDAQNSLAIADTHYHRIMIYNLEGELQQQFGEYGGEPGQMIYPTDVVRDEEGDFYITEYGDTDRVMKYSKDGEFITQWGERGPAPGQFQRPMSLTIHQERLYVADTCNHRLQVYDLTGRRLAVFGGLGDAPGLFKYPYDVAVDQQGRVYVCEYGGNRVQRLSAEGEPQAVWGGFGREPGQMCSPWGCAIDTRGRLIVADTMNHRIQLF